jgi:hypothetical protein
VIGPGDQPLEPGEHLAAVADAKGEGVGAPEEGLEGPAGFVVHEDGLGPSVARAKHVTLTAVSDIE